MSLRFHAGVVLVDVVGDGLFGFEVLRIDHDGGRHGQVGRAQRFQILRVGRLRGLRRFRALDALRARRSGAGRRFLRERQAGKHVRFRIFHLRADDFAFAGGGDVRVGQRFQIADAAAVHAARHGVLAGAHNADHAQRESVFERRLKLGRV